MGSNPAVGMNVLCCHVGSSRPADHSSRGALANAVCLNECDRDALLTRRPWPTKDCCALDGEGGNAK